MRKYPILEFARTLGVSVRVVYNWRDRGMPVEETPTQSLVDFEDWAKFYVGGTKSLNFQEEKARLTKYQADREQIRVEEAKKNLLNAEQVERAWSNLVAAFKSRMLAIPDRMASITGNAELKDDLKSMVYEALNELSKMDAKDLEPEELDESEPSDFEEQEERED